MPESPDSLGSIHFYTEGLKHALIHEDTARARESFAEAIRLDSGYAPAYYELASLHLKSDVGEAVRLAQRAVELDSTNIWYRDAYAQYLVMSNRYGEALKVFRTLMKEDPRNPDYYRLTAMLARQEGLPVEAVAVLDSAELRFGRIPQLGALKRKLLIDMMQYDEAIREAQLAVEEAPYAPENLLSLGEIYEALNRDSLALASYRRALEIDSTHVGTLMALSDYYNRRKETQGFFEITKRLFQSDEMPVETKVHQFNQMASDLQLYRANYFRMGDLAMTLAMKYPSEPDVVELYAQHLINSGELEQALAYYKLHTADTPPQRDYYKMIVDIESYLQRSDSVNLYVTRALALFPDDIDFRIAKGNAKIYAGRHDEAVKAYRQALTYAPNDSVRGAIWGYIGDAWHQKAEAADPGYEERLPRSMRTGAVRKAMKQCYDAYDRSLDLRAENPVVLNNYAYFLSQEERDLEHALAMSSRALDLAGNNPTYLDTHAWVLFKLGRLTEARKYMLQAVSLDTTASPELFVHYGDILEALGEKFMAEVYWKKALDKGYDADAIARRIERAGQKRAAPETRTQ